MKKTNSFLFIAMLSVISFTSCKDDDSSSLDGSSFLSENEIIANSQNETEDTKIPVASLSSGISIEDASKVTGTAPTPNNQVDFNLNSDITEAFQETGLKIQFSSDDSISGAYIQFKDTDGNATDTYFNVPLSSFNSTYLKSEKIAKTRKFNLSKETKNTVKSSKAAEDFTNEVQIDFNETIPAGEFCYDICLYDSNNNISQIQTVCVTVEAWGGNAAIVGEWIFDKREGDIFEDTATIECSNGELLITNYTQEIKNIYTLVLNSDGTYYETYDEETNSLDQFASRNTCSAIYSDEISFEKEKYSGNWAFNEDNQTLTAVDFKYEDLINLDNHQEYEDGRLYFEGISAEIISDQLVLSQIDGDYNNFKLYFNRK